MGVRDWESGHFATAKKFNQNNAVSDMSGMMWFDCWIHSGHRWLVIMEMMGQQLRESMVDTGLRYKRRPLMFMMAVSIV
jgi:hypothetical protein